MVQEAISNIGETLVSLKAIEAGLDFSKSDLLASYRIVSTARSQLIPVLTQLVFDQDISESEFYKEHWLLIESKYQYFKWFCRHLVRPSIPNLTNAYSKENLERKINKFYNKHVDLIIYWESLRTDMDDCYYTYASYDKNLIAKYLAYQALAEAIFNPVVNQSSNPALEGARLSQRDITLLIYAFHEDETFKGASLNEVKAKVESAFGVSIGSFHKYWSNYKKDLPASNILSRLSHKIENRASKETRQRQQKMQDFQ